MRTELGDNSENIMVTRLTDPQRRRTDGWVDGWSVHRIIVRRKIGFAGPLEKLGKSNEGGLILVSGAERRHAEMQTNDDFIRREKPARRRRPARKSVA